MQRLDDIIAVIRSGASFSCYEDAGKLAADLVKELKKFTPAELDNALNTLDWVKHAHGVATILSAKAINPQCSVEKLLKQAENFLSMFGPNKKLPKSLDAHQLFLFFRHLAERLLKDNSAILGLELFQSALTYANSGQVHQLTEIHSLFLQLCLESGHMKLALEMLNNEIYELPAHKNCDLDSCMNYFFYASVVLSSYDYFLSAVNYIETLFFFPNIGNVSSPVVVESYKKYILLSMLTGVRTAGLPKSVASQLESHLKKNVAAYIAVQELFNSDAYDFVAFSNLVAQHMPTFHQDSNAPLIRHCLRKYKTKELTKFAKEVAQRLELEDIDALESQLLDMAAYSDRIGRLNMETETITFSKQSTQTSTERMLISLQNTMAEMQVMGDAMGDIDKEIIASAEYLRKNIFSGDPMAREYMMHDMAGYMGHHQDPFSTSANGNFVLGAKPGRHSP